MNRLPLIDLPRRKYPAECLLKAVQAGLGGLDVKNVAEVEIDFPVRTV